MSTVVRLGAPASEPGWDPFVRAHPLGSTYHLTAWSRIVEGAYRSRPCYLALRAQDGTVTGVMPLFRNRGPLSGSRLTSMPVARVAGPLSDRAGAAQLVEAACQVARAEGVGQLVLRSHLTGLEDDVPGLDVVADQPTWVVSLEDDEVAMRTALRRHSKNVHRGIQRAERAGVAVRQAVTAADMRAFYRLYLATMRRHGALPRAFRQFLLEQRELGEGCRILIASHAGRDVATGVFHHFGDTLELLYNGSAEDALDVRPNHALYWDAIRQAIGMGCTRFDMGGALPATSLGTFKAQWGAEPVAIQRYTHVVGGASSGSTEAPPAMRVGGRRAVLEKAWHRTPLAVTRLAGTAAYRWL
jgi:CelD/BcsL family acetyltransferase involved in cellulose biosynthesis